MGVAGIAQAGRKLSRSVSPFHDLEAGGPKGDRLSERFPAAAEGADALLDSRSLCRAQRLSLGKPVGLTPGAIAPQSLILLAALDCGSGRVAGADTGV